MKIYDLKTAFGLSMESLYLDGTLGFEEVFGEDTDRVLEAGSVTQRPLVWLIYDDAQGAKGSFRVADARALSAQFESAAFLNSTTDSDLNLPEQIKHYIDNVGIQVVNTAYSDWHAVLDENRPPKWRVNVLGLGDVGGTLLTGLRMMGHGVIDQIGIFDLDPKKKRRWALELGQILDPNVDDYPEIVELEMDDLFNCDMFVFCASRSVPKVGSSVVDVRMVQYESNSKIIEPYARMARETNFKGIFAVVSDPVDQLCYRVYKSSNVDENDSFDGLGLKPEQVRGYGLGVMFARASYYAHENTIPFEMGRAFGPHGKELIVANHPSEYDEELSKRLTKLTVEANLEVREAGYKPFIAPALSSGALSLINTMKGNWNDSAVMLGGVYVGCRNRLTDQGVELERHTMKPELVEKLNGVVKVLKEYV